MVDIKWINTNEDINIYSLDQLFKNFTATNETINQPDAKDSYEQMMAINTQFGEVFRNIVIEKFNLIIHNEDEQIQFWRYIKNFSNTFQHILYARQVSTKINSPFYNIFREHLREEFDHDEMLISKNADWDPILDACENWFVTTASSGQDVEKLICVNTVIEFSGNIFSRELRGFHSKFAKYISVHEEHDEDHANVGVNYVREYALHHPHAAMTLLIKTWKMLLAMFERIAVLSRKSTPLDAIHS